jgi:hypothetical protein
MTAQLNARKKGMSWIVTLEFYLPYANCVRVSGVVFVRQQIEHIHHTIQMERRSARSVFGSSQKRLDRG